MREYTQSSSSSRAGLECFVEKKHNVKRVGSLFAARLESERRLKMLKSRAERSALGAAPDVAVVDVCLKFLSPNT